MPWNEVGKEVWNESPGFQGVEKNKERKKRTYRIHCSDDHRTSLEAGCYSKLKFDLRRPPPRRSKILGERFPFPLKDDDPRLPVSKQQNKNLNKQKRECTYLSYTHLSWRRLGYMPVFPRKLSNTWCILWWCWARMEGVAIMGRGTMLEGHPPPDPQNLLRKLTMKNLSKVCLVYPPPPKKPVRP